MLLSDLTHYLNGLLEVSRFKDYSPNGLQVEGRAEVESIVTGVTASLDLLSAACETADAILVHHGYFWKNEDPRIISTKRARLSYLFQHNVNLLAYHLPLDAHPTFGNNAQLAFLLGLEIHAWFGEQNVAAYGAMKDPIALEDFSKIVAERLNRAPTVIGDAYKPIRRVAWCSGAAQALFPQAIELGVDAFLTGEISEYNVHLARESGVAFISAGHHATERYGVQALGSHLATRFGLKHRFIDCDNPV